MRRRVKRFVKRRGCECTGGAWRFERPIVDGRAIVGWLVLDGPDCWHRMRWRLAGTPAGEPYAGYWCGADGARLVHARAGGEVSTVQRYIVCEPGVSLARVLACV